jgi:hypothetical protein
MLRSKFPDVEPIHYCEHCGDFPKRRTATSCIPISESRNNYSTDDVAEEMMNKTKALLDFLKNVTDYDFVRGNDITLSAGTSNIDEYYHLSSEESKAFEHVYRSALSMQLEAELNAMPVHREARVRFSESKFAEDEKFDESSEDGIFYLEM